MSILNYDNEYEKQKAAKAAEDLKASNAATWERILGLYPIASHTANFRMVEEFCQGIITLDKFQFLIQQEPKGFNLDWTDERQSLLQDIAEFIVDKYGRKIPAYELQTQMNPYRLMNRMQLRATLVKLKASAELRKQSPAQIRADLQAQQEAQRESQFGYRDSKGRQWPRLLPTIVPPGEVQSVKTGEYFHSLRKRRDDASTYWLKKYIAQFGDEQVTKFIQQP